MKNSWLFLILMTSFAISGCVQCKNECEDVHPLEFDLPLSAHGVMDTLTVGDTVRIRFDIPNKIEDRNTGTVYAFENYNFKLITYLSRIDTSPTDVQNYLFGNFTTTIGSAQSLGEVYGITPLFDTDTYRFEAEIVLKKKGLYLFGMNSDYNGRFPLDKVSGYCADRKSVNLFMKLDGVPNPHFDFLQHSPDPIYRNLKRSRFDEFAGFCFYVR